MKAKKQPKLAYVIYKEDGEFVARIPALNISEFGATRAEALQNLAEMEEEVFEIEKEHGNPIPTYEESLIALNSIKRGGKRANAGRKKMNTEEKKSQKVVLYFSQKEMNKLKDVAQSLKFASVAKYISNIVSLENNM